MDFISLISNLEGAIVWYEVNYLTPRLDFLSFSVMNDASFLLLSAKNMEEFFIDLLGDKSCQQHCSNFSSKDAFEKLHFLDFILKEQFKCYFVWHWH